MLGCVQNRGKLGHVSNILLKNFTKEFTKFSFDTNRINAMKRTFAKVILIV